MAYLPSPDRLNQPQYKESGIGNRESGIGNRESGIGNRESGIANVDLFGIGSVKAIPTTGIHLIG
ncbi:hypothetical protein [Moorena producens]|uniref:hypothetical protein n=1 Tax=Moorena producens TaxID=1155739 RepID=UPI003C734B1C